MEWFSHTMVLPHKHDSMIVLCLSLYSCVSAKCLNMVCFVMFVVLNEHLAVILVVCGWMVKCREHVERNPSIIAIL